MATFYSTQITNFRAVPKVMGKPSELAGRVRTAYFDYVTPASSAPAVGEYVILTKVPANARVLDGVVAFEAMSSGGGTAGADFGPAADDAGTSFAADYGTAINMDAAGSSRLTPAVDKLPSLVYTAEKYICAKVTGEAWAVSKKVQGCFTYVVD
jgi:hypothetical protein